jgi:hypothetical protein
MADGPRFGEQPLAQTVAAAGALRRLTNLLLSLEHDHPAVDDMLARFAQWEIDLTPEIAADPAPRIGDDPDGSRRVYLQHAFDIGHYNPCFPEYRFDSLEADGASGTVMFPVAYEGPPGLVHGGFLGVFFDSVVQHHNCATRLSGKTRSLTIAYRRPTPLLTELRFDIIRAEAERAITSTARLLLGDDVLCTGEVATVALRPDRLTGYAFGARRVR